MERVRQNRMDHRHFCNRTDRRREREACNSNLLTVLFRKPSNIGSRAGPCPPLYDRHNQTKSQGGWSFCKGERRWRKVFCRQCPERRKLWGGKLAGSGFLIRRRWLELGCQCCWGCSMLGSWDRDRGSRWVGHLARVFCHRTKKVKG